MVTNSGKFFGWPFGTDRGVNQGYLVSPTVFNIMVDAVAREVLLEICGPGWATGEHNIVFYGDDGRI